MATPCQARCRHHGRYHSVFRYFGLDALLTTGKAVALYALAFIGLLLWPMWPTFPLTWGILQPILFFLLVGASRVLAQFWLTGISLGKQPSQGRMLIFGAGASFS